MGTGLRSHASLEALYARDIVPPQAGTLGHNDKTFAKVRAGPLNVCHRCDTIELRDPHEIGLPLQMVFATARVGVIFALHPSAWAVRQTNLAEKGNRNRGVNAGNGDFCLPTGARLVGDNAGSHQESVLFSGFCSCWGVLQAFYPFWDFG